MYEAQLSTQRHAYEGRLVKLRDQNDQIIKETVGVRTKFGESTPAHAHSIPFTHAHAHSLTLTPHTRAPCVDSPAAMVLET